MTKPIHDHGKAHEWGRVSDDYALYRDIYPESLYEAFGEMDIGLTGQRVLDLGTGTGVIPRGMIGRGAMWEGTDPDGGQINAARRLAEEQGLHIPFSVGSAESIDATDNAYDAVTAVQCFFYFDREQALREIARVLKPGGLFAIATMMWLPHEDAYAADTEALVIRYNPAWTGHGYRVKPMVGDEWGMPLFAVKEKRDWNEPIHFTHEGWRGRIRACRGVGAALPPDRAEEFDRELEKRMESWPEILPVLHHIAVMVFEAI